MKYDVTVEDSLGNESTFEINATNAAEARNIARNKHILIYKLGNVRAKVPVIWTFLEESSSRED
jgi:hypothetical protein